VDIVDMARVPGRPSEMGRLTAAALGLVFGLALGVAGAFFMSQFDQRAQDLSTIESLMGIPLLSVTPALDAPIDTIDSSFARSTSPFLESMWQLRGALLLSNSGQGPRKILFTSCNLGEGSTTIACAQACALALRDARVLLIDGDMRRPAVMRLFGLSNEVGLSSVLSETTSAERSLQAVKGIPNLAVMTSGPVPASAPLLLSAERMRTLLGPVMQKFDFILIDSPPFLGLVDSSSLAQFSDAVVLVSSYAKLKRPQVTRVAKVLNRIGRSIVGVALNFADSESMSSYGYSSPYRTLKKGDRA
jgi:capsular exopolysaccharide synthesis family protein